MGNLSSSYFAYGTSAVATTADTSSSSAAPPSAADASATATAPAPGDGGAGEQSNDGTGTSTEPQQQPQPNETILQQQRDEAAQKAPTTAAPKDETKSAPPTGNVLPLLANGQFMVGCTDIMLAERPEHVGLAADERVGVFARIFYPSATEEHDPSTAGSSREYMRWRPDSEYMEGLANYQGMSVSKLNFFVDWIVGDKKVPVYWQAPIVPGDQRFPLLIFSHGISGSRFVYATLCASMASHGYVVAAMEHRDGSSCWTYSLEPEPSTCVDQQQNNVQQNGVVAEAEPGPEAGGDQQQQQRQEEGVPRQQQHQKEPTPPPPLVRRPMEMRKLPHEEQEYQTRVGQVQKRVDETVQMCRIFAKMDADGLQIDDAFGHQRILLGQTFDWSQFKCRLALDHVVSMGHSFGAASALAACAHRPALFNACVLLDAWLYPVERRLYPAVVQPVLMLNVSKWQWPRNVRRMQRLLTTPMPPTSTTSSARNSDDGNTTATTTDRIMFTLKDIVHQSFSDFGFLMPGRVGRYIGVQGDLDPLLTGTAIIEMVLNFLEPQQQQQQHDHHHHHNDVQNGEENSNSSTTTTTTSIALDRLRRLVADKYAHFILDGTDIPQEKLDEVSGVVEAEQVAEEERKVANDGSVDTTTPGEMASSEPEVQQQQNGGGSDA